MQTDTSPPAANDDRPTRGSTALAPRRLVALPGPPPSPKRRGAPRRRDVMPVAIERRRTDRRRRAPGIDGLMRTVISDAWPA